MKKYFLLVLLLILLAVPITATEVGTTHDFEFTLLGGETKSLSDYSDKPVLLDWTASWCGLCKQNLKNLDTIYSEYSDRVHFITLSYFGSGDDLDDVQDIKNIGPYPWLFGLDTENYAGVAGAANAYIWIMSSNLTVVSLWEYQIVSTTDLRTALNTVIASEPTTTETTSDTVSNTTTQATDESIEQTSSQTSVDTGPEIESLDIGSNPLFLGFIGVAAVGILVVVINRFR